MRLSRTVFWALVWASTVGSAAAADPLLGRYNISRNIGILGASTHITHETYLSPFFGVFSGEGTLFESILLFDGDVRTDIIMSDADDGDFGKYTDRITDGVNWLLYDYVEFSNGNGIAFFGEESQRLPLPRFPGPDLQGQTITRVVRHMELHLASPGSDPNGDGQWTDMQIESTIEVYGVPGPGVLGVFAAAGALVGRRRREE